MVEGEWAGRVTGLGNQTVEIAMMVTPDGHSRLEKRRLARHDESPNYQDAGQPASIDYSFGRHKQILRYCQC